MQDVSKLMAQIEAKEEMISVLKEIVEVLKRTLDRKNNPVYTIDTKMYKDFDKSWISTQMGSIINTPNSTEYTVHQAGTSNSDPYWKKNP
jgi:hydrogenase maturation factor